MDLQRKLAIVRAVKARLRVNKVVCTRSVKGKGGDVFVGYSASAWDTTQEEAGMGTGFTETLDVDDEQINAAQQGMNVFEARVAGLLLGVEVDTLAYDRAAAGSVVEAHVHRKAKKTIVDNYNMLLNNLITEKAPGVEVEVEVEDVSEAA